MAPEYLPFIDYANAIEDELESVYGLPIFDAGIGLEQLAHAQEAGKAQPSGSTGSARSTTSREREEVCLI